MNVGRIIKITFYFSVAIIVFKGAQVVHRKYFSDNEVGSGGRVHRFNLDFKDIKISEPNVSDANNGGASSGNVVYDFKRMLDLIEACEKVKYLDYLQFSKPKDVAQVNQVNPETMQALINALHEEKSRLKKHISQLKSGSKESIPSKRMKALKYYLRVVEVNLQDLKGIASGKPADQSD